LHVGSSVGTPVGAWVTVGAGVTLGTGVGRKAVGGVDTDGFGVGGGGDSVGAGDPRPSAATAASRTITARRTTPPVDRMIDESARAGYPVYPQGQ